MTLAKQSAHRRVLAAALRWGKACDEIKVVVQAKRRCMVRDPEDSVGACSELTNKDLERMFGTDRSADPSVEENCESCYRAHGDRHLKPADVDAMRHERGRRVGTDRPSDPRLAASLSAAAAGPACRAWLPAQARPGDRRTTPTRLDAGRPDPARSPRPARDVVRCGGRNHGRGADLAGGRREREHADLVCAQAARNDRRECAGVTRTAVPLRRGTAEVPRRGPGAKCQPGRAGPHDTPSVGACAARHATQVGADAMAAASADAASMRTVTNGQIADHAKCMVGCITHALSMLAAGENQRTAWSLWARAESLRQEIEEKP